MFQFGQFDVQQEKFPVGSLHRIIYLNHVRYYESIKARTC